MPDDIAPEFTDELELSINAWTGQPIPPAGQAGDWKAWLWSRESVPPLTLAADEPVDLRNWQDPQVGWGLLLSEDPDVPASDKARALDAPEPIRRLLDSRPGSPVFRYSDAIWARGSLARYYEDGTSQEIGLTDGVRGTGRGALPFYLLMVGAPTVIPWEVQYRLNLPCCVGRLDLPEPDLANYVDHLLRGWQDSSASAQRPVVWSTDHGARDITHLMRIAIADPVLGCLRGDDQIGNRARGLGPGDATSEQLIASLAEQNPALVVTTSHGMTGPLDDPAEMEKNLGLLVDSTHTMLDTGALLSEWAPDGTIWYAHACCSAGADSRTRYEGLVREGSAVDQVLKGVAAAGPRVSPLPTRLLSAAKPARAFIGHVEPTFNWTLQRPETRQITTESITNALYNRMYRKDPEPVGLAFRSFYNTVGQLLASWEMSMRRVGDGDFDARQPAMRSRLTALDRQSLVLLGDPTVALPKLP